MEPADAVLEALVIGGADYGEADRVVHLLTGRGRLTVFAHGAKKSRRRFAGALEPFATIEATLQRSRRGAGGMPSLTSARVESARLGLRADLGRIALASHVVELAGRVAPEGEPAEPLLGLVRQALDHLVAAPATVTARRAFELRLLSILGFEPELGGCVVCGAEAPAPGLDLGRGGVLCAAHREGAREVGPRTLVWMREVLARDDFVPEVELDPEWAARAAAKAAPILDRALEGLLERPLKSLGLLRAEGL